VSQDNGRWVVRAVCVSAAGRDTTLEVLGHLWPRETRTAVVHVQLREG